MPTPLLAVHGPLPLELPVRPLPEVSWLQAHLSFSPVKALLPLPILAAVAPAIWWFFRDTWRELDEEAARHRGDLVARDAPPLRRDRKSTRLNSSHMSISYAVFCLKKKKKQ